MASDSNDLAFVLDDTEKSEDDAGALVRTLKSVVHMVPGGRSKIISRGVDQARFPQLRWSGFALTSSPRRIQRIAAKHRWHMSPGDGVRLFDIGVPGPEKGGIFDRIKGDNAQRAKRSIELIAKLERGFLNHHGHTIPLSVQYLMATDRSKRILQLVDEFINHVKARGNGWEVRFATKFGLVYAAMQMATDVGLLPWRPGFALKVGAKCYRKARAAARGHAERDNDRIGMRSRKQAAQPLSEPRVASAQGRQGRPSALDQHLAQVLAAAFGNAEQTRLASCRRLPRDKPKPRGEVATPSESLCITDGRDKRSCVKRANPGNARQPAGGLVPFCLCCELSIEYRDPLVEPLPPRQHVLNQELDTRA